jgi:hypothetical protein
MARGLLVLVGGVFGGLGLLWVLNWGVYHFALRLTELRRAQAITPEIQALAILARLRPDQMAFAVDHGIMPAVELVTGDPDDEADPGVAIFLRVVGGDLVPLDFVDAFFDRSRRTFPHLAPIRTWSEGTRERELAELLTAHLVVLDLADRARGPYAARLKVPPGRAMKRAGLGLRYNLEEEST